MAINLIEAAKAKVKKLLDLVPPVQAYKAVQQMRTPQWQEQAKEFFSQPTPFRVGQAAGQALQKVPEVKPFGKFTQTLAPGLVNIPQLAQSYGRTLERVSTPKIAIKQYKTHPFATGLEDVGNLADFAPIGIIGGLAASKVQSVMEAKALKPLLPEVRSIRRMLGEVNDIPKLSPSQFKAVEGIIAKLKGENGLEKLWKLNPNASDFYNSARSLLDATEGQILNPTIKFGMGIKNIRERPLGDATKGTRIPLSSKRLGTELSSKEASQFPSVSTKPKVGLPTTRIAGMKSAETQALDDIISQGRAKIGGKIEEPKVNLKQTFDDFYTQWVDRYNPLVKASKQAKKALATKGAELLPQNDPEYLVRRLTGAGGIADNRFRTELNPVLKEIETSGIPKIDMDTYLANKRLAGFGTIGRDIYGNDPIKAGKVVMALDQKYGPKLGELADQLYKYQDRGFQEIIDAGFISPENAQIIKSQNPDYSPLYRVMDKLDDYLGLPTRKAMQGTQPIKQIKGSTRQIESPVESIIGNTFRQRAAIEKNRVAKSVIELQKVAPELDFKQVSQSAEDTITIWENGQKQFWQVGKDIADVAKGVNEEAMNLVLRIIQAPAQILRQGATGRNPEFMIPNIIRDQLDAGISSKYGYIPFVDYVSGLKSLITKDDIYQRWANSGAKIDLGEMSGKKSIKQLFDNTKPRIGLFKWMTKTLDVMGQFSEQPTRIGLFKKAFKKTGNELLAAMESRDATVDFARMGAKMKVANSIIPFLNVGVQGFDKIIRAAKANPMKVLLNATIYGAMPAAATTIYNLTNYPDEYMEIPQYEKDSNFVLVTGRNADGTVNYVTFPKGNILPAISNPVQSFIEFAKDADQQTFGELALQTLSTILPVVGKGQSLQEIGLKTIGANLPQAVKPLTENLLNKSFYKYDIKKEQTKEIVPYYLQEKPAYKQGYEFTPKMYQFLGAVFNASPLKVQNLLEGYFAGYVKIPAQIVQMLTKTANGEQVSPNDKTIIRRFIKQTYPTSTKSNLKVKPKVPGIMERVVGEVGAAEVPKEEIDARVKAFKESDLPYAEVAGRLYYKTDTGTSSVSTNFDVQEPKYTGDSLIDKELLADYKGEITAAKNAVMKAFGLGYIDQGTAMKALQNLKIKSQGTKTGTKAKKPKMPKFVPIKFGKSKKITGLTKKKGVKLVRAPKLKQVKF